MESPCGRLAVGQVPQGHGCARVTPGLTLPRALRRVDLGERPKARRGRRARPAGRGGQDEPGGDGARLRHHPAGTAAITGPTDDGQLEGQLKALEVQLGDDLLDRIDETVPPGTNVNPNDVGWQNPALRLEARRARRGMRRALVRWSDGPEGEALTWYAVLCGCPHKSSYAETRVLPRGSRDRPRSAGGECKDRHNSRTVWHATPLATAWR